MVSQIKLSHRRTAVHNFFMLEQCHYLWLMCGLWCRWLRFFLSRLNACDCVFVWLWNIYCEQIPTVSILFNIKHLYLDYNYNVFFSVISFRFRFGIPARFIPSFCVMSSCTRFKYSPHKWHSQNRIVFIFHRHIHSILLYSPRNGSMMCVIAAYWMWIHRTML